MTFPETLRALLFPKSSKSDAHTLFGIALGDNAAGIALPAWWSDSHSDGATRYGWLEINEGGVRSICASFTQTLGRVSRVELTCELDDAAAEESVHTALRDALTARCGAGTKSSKRRTGWSVAPVDGSLAGALGLNIASCASDDVGDIWRVELDLSLADGVEITADARSLFIDVRALADVLATPAWPVEKCVDVLGRYFAKESAGYADIEDVRAWRAILDAAKEARDVRPMIERVCALMEWDVDKSHATRVHYVLAEIGPNEHSAAHGRVMPSARTWMGASWRDVVFVMQLLDVPAPERAAWGWKVVRALAWGEAPALDEVRNALAMKKRDAWRAPAWESSAEVEARLYELLTSDRDDTGRMLWPLEVGTQVGTARACMESFARAGRAAPTLKGTHSGEQLAWVSYVAFLQRELDASAFDAAFTKLVERLALSYKLIVRAICDELATSSEIGPTKSTWHVGGLVVTHTGNPARGKLSVKAAPAAKTAKAPRASKAPKAPKKEASA